MQITALGHSCLLLAFSHADTGETVRILIDPWLSDHAIGDGMGRFPRVRFDAADLGPIDAVFISHAHSDHLDPYTLVRLWQALPAPPVLLLPVSLSFLLPVFRAHLAPLDVCVLEPHQPIDFRGVELFGMFDLGLYPSNEDDVMVLVATHGTERVLVEADARLSLEDPGFRAHISALMREPGIDSAVFLTTENELTGTLEGRSCDDVDQREELVADATEEMVASVEVLYQPVDDPDDLWLGDHVLRLVHGQGLTAPHELDPRWQRILFPVRIADRVREEREAAERNGCAHRIEALVVGSVHTVRAGRLVDVAPMPGLSLLDAEEQRTFDVTLPFFPVLPTAPLRSDERDVAVQRTRILGLLNNRFLSYLHGRADPPVLHLLAEHDGAYRIRVHHGNQVDADARDYVLRHDAWGFVSEPPHLDLPDEAYWANDLEDFLDGRCDEFTTFCRRQFPYVAYRLWACLATPLLNSDLVRKRVALHFARASAGHTPGTWVLPLYDDVAP